MNFKLHVLTPVTRPQNLTLLAESLRAWGNVDVTWHLRFDPHHEHVGGYELRNQMLADITDGWVWCLDDDCTAHPKLYRRAAFLAKRGAAAIVVSQFREDGTVLEASLENIYVGGIDIGQAILRRDLIGDRRYPLYYTGDGDFLVTVLTGAELDFVPEVLSYHNNIEETP